MNFLEKMNMQTALPDRYKQMDVVEMKERVSEIKSMLGKKLFIPGHHYQKDEVIQFADQVGDSLKLAQLSKQNSSAEWIVFLGVHFMAETADILTGRHQKVLLPDLRAGCSMADMANINETVRAWTILQEKFGDTILPLTYVNSAASIKAFCGKHGGATVTSSNALNMMNWAFARKQRILFLPDQHLGRNTAFQLGVSLKQMAVWDPIEERLEFEGEFDGIRVILWKGHCSVHEKFTIENVTEIRKGNPLLKIVVHPECSHDVVQRADASGSTNEIIQMIESSPPGSSWAVGTEMNLVNRLAKRNPDKVIVSLNPAMCPCLTMNRITLPHLTWVLEELERGNAINPIQVDEYIAIEARLAIARMLELSL